MNNNINLIKDRLNQYIHVIQEVAQSMNNWFGHQYVKIDHSSVQLSNYASKSSLKEVAEDISHFIDQNQQVLVNEQVADLKGAFDTITAKFIRRHTGSLGRLFNYLFFSAKQKENVQQTLDEIQSAKSKIQDYFSTYDYFLSDQQEEFPPIQNPIDDFDPTKLYETDFPEHETD